MHQLFAPAYPHERHERHERRSPACLAGKFSMTVESLEPLPLKSIRLLPNTPFHIAEATNLAYLNSCAPSPPPWRTHVRAESGPAPLHRHYRSQHKLTLYRTLRQPIGTFALYVPRHLRASAPPPLPSPAPHRQSEPGSLPTTHTDWTRTLLRTTSASLLVCSLRESRSVAGSTLAASCAVTLRRAPSRGPPLRPPLASPSSTPLRSPFRCDRCRR